MKDKNGLFYYPFPENRRVRAYVQKNGDEIFFRLWNQDDPKLWEAHGWVPYEAIRQAAAMFTKKTFDPKTAYDIRLAQALIAEDKESTH